MSYFEELKKLVNNIDSNVYAVNSMLGEIQNEIQEECPTLSASGVTDLYLSDERYEDELAIKVYVSQEVDWFLFKNLEIIMEKYNLYLQSIQPEIEYQTYMEEMKIYTVLVFVEPPRGDEEENQETEE